MEVIEARAMASKLPQNGDKKTDSKLDSKVHLNRLLINDRKTNQNSTHR